MEWQEKGDTNIQPRAIGQILLPTPSPDLTTCYGSSLPPGESSLPARETAWQGGGQGSSPVGPHPVFQAGLCAHPAQGVSSLEVEINVQ